MKFRGRGDKRSYSLPLCTPIPIVSFISVMYITFNAFNYFCCITLPYYHYKKIEFIHILR